MKQNKGIKLAYLAGVIDSDGSIAIGKHTKRVVNPQYHLQIVVNQADGRIIDWLYGAFGGRVFSTGIRPTLGTREMWRWEIRGHKAGEICKKLIPFLRYKKHQAEIGYRLQTLIEKGCKNSGQRNYRSKPLTKKEIDQREMLYQKMKQLKQIFIPCAAAETKRSKPSNDGKR